MKNSIQFIVIVVAFLMAGCSSIHRINLSSLELGMSKKEVIRNLGEPDNIIGTKQFEDGLVEVMQYSSFASVTAVNKDYYWLYFLNNKLEQWGRPGDWEREADTIYEVRINSPSLSPTF